MTRYNRGGFTLIELVIYVAIFSVVSVFLTGTLFTTLRIQNRESAATEVQSQLNLVLQTVQRLVRESSLIEDVFQGTAPAYSPAGVLTNPCSSSYCSVQLRMEDSDLDPTIIRSDSTTKIVYVKQGSGAETAVTTSAVVVNSFILAKNETPGAHAILKIDASLSNNTNNPQHYFTKSINSAVGRANAATFDSDLLPNADDQFDVGQTVGAMRWRNGNFSDDVTVGGSLGIGTTSPSQKIEVAGGVKITGSGNGITFPDGSVQVTATAATVGGGWTMDPPISPATVNTVRLTNTTDVVGIGTTTVASGYKLHVNGQTKIVGGLTVDNLVITGTCTGCGSGVGSGTVTNVATGTGLSGGPITTTGTITMPGLSTCTAAQATRWDGTNWSCVSAGSGSGTPGGTNGQVQFNNSGAFGADSNLYWDNTSKRLGIGTAAPATSLQLGANAGTLGVLGLAGNTSGLLRVAPPASFTSWTLTLPTTTGTSGQFLQTNGSGTTTWATPAGAGAGTVTGTGTPDVITKWDATGTGIQDSVIIENPGVSVNIGLDLTAPHVETGEIVSHGIPVAVSIENPPGAPSAVTVVLINGSGLARVPGEIVIAGPGAFQFTVAIPGIAPSSQAIGVVIDGMPGGGAPCIAGAICRIAVGGIAQALCGPGCAIATHVVTANAPSAAGTAAGNAAPPAGTSIGTWLQPVGAGGFGMVLLH